MPSKKVNSCTNSNTCSRNHYLKSNEWGKITIRAIQTTNINKSQTKSCLNAGI